MQNKPVVHFSRHGGYACRFDDGQYASVFAEDHPRLGREWVITSLVVKKNEDGSFETMNTIYVPVKEESDDTTN